MVQISRLGEVNVSYFLSELLDARVSVELHEVAKLIAVNEAVFKSLSPRSQKRFRGVAPLVEYVGYIDLIQNRRCFALTFTQTQVTVSHSEDFVIAVAISKRSIRRAFKILMQFSLISK